MPSANSLHSYQERTALKSLQGAGPTLAQDVTGGRGWGDDGKQNAALFKALEGVGKGALGIYNNWLETKLLEGYTQFQGELSAEKNRYFTENQGENALGAAEHFTQFAAERQAAWLEQYSGRAHNAFGRMSTQATLHFAETGAGYARQQKNAWEDSVLKGAIAQHDQAVAENYANGDYIAAQTDALKERIAAIRPGLDNSAVYAQIDRSTVGNRIGAYLASNNIGAAKALFAQQGPLLGGQADEYMARIRRAEDSNILRGEAAARRNEKVRETAAINNAYEQLYNVPTKNAIATIRNPEWQRAYGMTPDAAGKLTALIHTMDSHQQTAIREERAEYKNFVATKAVNMALGVNGEAKNTLGAMQLVDESDLDGSDKLALRDSLGRGAVGAKDNPFVVNDISARIVETGGAVHDSVFTEAVARGDMTIATMESQKRLRTVILGGDNSSVKLAFSTLDGAFNKGWLSGSTPEDAAAKQAASLELQADIEYAQKTGDRSKLNAVTSPEHVLALTKKHKLTPVQSGAALIRASVGEGSQQPAQAPAPKPVENPAHSDVFGGIGNDALPQKRPQRSSPTQKFGDYVGGAGLQSTGSQPKRGGQR